jgi:hypothetical protein
MNPDFISCDSVPLVPLTPRLLRFSDSVSTVEGVFSNNPDPIPSVRGVDGASWNNKRLAFVALGFHLRKQVPEDHPSLKTKDSRRVLKDCPCRLDFGKQSKSFRPEPAVIFFASTLPGNGGGLAGNASCEKVDSDFMVYFALFVLCHS